MKLGKYIIDKLLLISVFISCYFIILLLLVAFKNSFLLIISITFIYIIMGSLLFFIPYFQKKKFYNELVNYVNLLDKKYLILEMLPKPSFYEGEVLYQALYDINKSMAEAVKMSEDDIEDFKEYIEMWIHEVKIPISSLTLLCHNHKDTLDKSYLEQVKRLDQYIDQVLYYVRSNYTEEDFVIKKVELEKIVSSVLLKNKDDLLAKKIDLFVDLDPISIYTDSKWLEFILNQIINNSIKYQRKSVKSYIKIFLTDSKDFVTLHLLDNGIGIPKSDLSQVFKKSFTGENGRSFFKSTGMGLYIADKLCKKLGHKIEIESVHKKSTEVRIIFGKNKYYTMD